MNNLPSTSMNPNNLQSSPGPQNQTSNYSNPLLPPGVGQGQGQPPSQFSHMNPAFQAQVAAYQRQQQLAAQFSQQQQQQQQQQSHQQHAQPGQSQQRQGQQTLHSSPGLQSQQPPPPQQQQPQQQQQQQQQQHQQPQHQQQKQQVPGQRAISTGIPGYQTGSPGTVGAGGPGGYPQTGYPGFGGGGGGVAGGVMVGQQGGGGSMGKLPAGAGFGGVGMTGQGPQAGNGVTNVNNNNTSNNNGNGNVNVAAGGSNGYGSPHQPGQFSHRPPPAYTQQTQAQAQLTAQQQLYIRQQAKQSAAFGQQPGNMAYLGYTQQVGQVGGGNGQGNGGSMPMGQSTQQQQQLYQQQLQQNYAASGMGGMASGVAGGADGGGVLQGGMAQSFNVNQNQYASSPGMSVRPPPQFGQHVSGQQYPNQHSSQQLAYAQQQQQQPAHLQGQALHRPQSAASQRSFHNPSPSPAPNLNMAPQNRNTNSPYPPLAPPQPRKPTPGPTQGTEKKGSNPSVTGKRKAPPEPGAAPPRSHKKKVPPVVKSDGQQAIGQMPKAGGAGAQQPHGPTQATGGFAYPQSVIAHHPTPPLAANSAANQLPFDPVLVPYLGLLRDPAAAQRLQHSNPQLFADVVHVSEMIRSGAVSQQVLQAMLTAQAGAGQAKMGLDRGLQNQNQVPAGALSFAQGQSNPMMAAPSARLSMPNTVPGAPNFQGSAQQGGPNALAGGAEMNPTVAPPPLVDRNIVEWERALDPRFPLIKITPITSEVDEFDDPTLGGVLPEISEREVRQIREWLDRDLEYGRDLEDLKVQTAAKMGTLRDHLGEGMRWWEKDKRERRPRPGLKLLWPAEKAARREETRRRGKSTVQFSKKQLRAMAKAEDRLVPIRLDIEHDQLRFRDTFVWNASDTVVTPTMFAKTICEDFGLPEGVFLPKIIAVIAAKVEESRNMVITADAGGTDNAIGMDEAEMQRWKALVRSEPDKPSTPVYDNDDVHDKELNDQPLTIEELMQVAGSGKIPSEDLRVKIQLDIISGTMELSDSFEWDLLSPVSPEHFADVYAADLGLNGEFRTAIVHDIREQTQNYLRSLIMTGYGFDGAPVLDIDLRNELLPPVLEAVRKDDIASSAFTPFLNNITDADVERLEYEREREKKKKGRNTRGRRLVALPDREPIRTNRTRIRGLDERGQPLTLAAAPSIILQFKTPPRRAENRRAAAVAATANITSITAEMSQKDEEIEDKILAMARSKKGRLASNTPGASEHAREGSIQERSLRGTLDPPTSEGLPQTCIDCKQLRLCNSDTLCQECAPQDSNSLGPAIPDKLTPVMIKEENAADGVPGRRSRSSMPTFQTVTSPDSDDQTPAVRALASVLQATGDSVSGVPGSPLRRVPSATPSAPAWFTGWLRTCKVIYPGARLDSVYKGKSTPDAPENSAWRVKCLDCPGKVYTLGPGDSMQNFELHLKNRKHLEAVAKGEAARR